MKKDTFTFDLVNKTIDNMLKQDISIMFIRQATYLYLVKLDNFDKKSLYNRIKERAKIHHLNFNAGVLSKELSVTMLCSQHWNKYFNNVEITEASAVCIKKIAGIMKENNLTYNKLKNLIVSNSASQQKTKTITLQDVKTFLQSCNDKEIKELRLFIDSLSVTDKTSKIKAA